MKVRLRITISGHFDLDTDDPDFAGFYEDADTLRKVQRLDQQWFEGEGPYEALAALDPDSLEIAVRATRAPVGDTAA